MRKYNHSIANYPSNFVGTVISPHKICLQFENVISKLRIAYRDDSDLIKLPTTERAMPLVTEGVGIHVLAVGCPMPVLEKLQDELLKAYNLYNKTHSEYYERTYEKSFKNFLIQTRDKLNEIIDAQ